MEIAKIDLNDYRLSGEGSTGNSYDCISNPDMMLKLFNPEYPVQPVYDENEIAKKVYAMGVPSPEPGEIVTDGNRIGILFRRVKGKRSFSRMLSDEPERTEEFSREFARICKSLHSMECPEGFFPDIKDVLRTSLERAEAYSDREKKFLAGLIDEFPDGRNAIHGDLHIGNVICTLPKGAPLSAPHDTYFIDLGFFSHGHPLLDIPGMIGTCAYGREEYITHDLHISLKQARDVFEYFFDEYFFAQDRIADKWFGPNQTRDSVKRILDRAFCVKFITVTYVLGFKLPEYDEVLQAMMVED